MANPLAAALGPVGGLAGCACCLILAAIWGLFATTIALAVYTKQWNDALRSSFSLGSGAEHVFYNQLVLIGILCIYGYLGIRRALRTTA